MLKDRDEEKLGDPIYGLDTGFLDPLAPCALLTPQPSVHTPDTLALLPRPLLAQRLVPQRLSPSLLGFRSHTLPLEYMCRIRAIRAPQVNIMPILRSWLMPVIAEFMRVLAIIGACMSIHAAVVGCRGWEFMHSALRVRVS